MDVAKILTELRQEREHIEDAIISLERLARSRGKRRGRPPAWLAMAKKKNRTYSTGGKTKAAAGNKPAAT